MCGCVGVWPHVCHSFVDHPHTTRIPPPVHATDLQNKDYAKWAMTVQTAPAFIPNTMQLRSISELIYNPTKRALMTKAIVSYLNE